MGSSKYLRYKLFITSLGTSTVLTFSGASAEECLLDYRLLPYICRRI